MALQIPQSFSTLDSLLTVDQETQLNTIGVVVDVIPAAKSRGLDYTIKFTLHDNNFTAGQGIPVRFFHREEDKLPQVKTTGDVVILRNLKFKRYGGDRTLLSNSSSSWVVLEYASLNDCPDPTADTADVKMHLSTRSVAPTAKPSKQELAYAKALLDLEDTSRWQAPPRATALQIAQIQAANGGTPTQSQVVNRFTTISSLHAPANHQKLYIDLFCEVRRMYNPEGNRVEMSVTDYTEHDRLYNYAPVDEDSNGAFDGDRFGYIDSTNKLWPGPWGKMTMLIILWPPHSEEALKTVTLGSFVYLKKVHVKLDKDESKLEGVMHTDNFYASRVNVSVWHSKDAGDDKRFVALLQRKKAYEEHCKKHQLRFIRDAKPRDTDPKRKPSVSHSEPRDEKEETATSLTAKQKRNQRNKQRRKAKAAARADPDKHDSEAEMPNAPAPSTNAYVRTQNHDVPLTSIISILDPDALLRKTPAGNSFNLPFQNCVYKSKVRVVDFFPDHLEDFAVPVKENQYAALNSDAESEESGSDMEISASEDDGVRWQWRFVLLVEDPSAPKANAKHQLELLVANSDAEYLLNEVKACNLRRNPKMLAQLREKLFVLWGDLEERKREHEAEVEREKGRALLQGHGKTSGVPAWGVGFNASARPFECFIKEYGVRTLESRGRIVDEGEEMKEWDRVWRLCFTTCV
jgi:protection of telomeres protein 1